MRRFLLPMLAMLAVLVVGCGGGEGPTVAGRFDIGHIHDISIRADGTILMAAHTGLYRVDGPERAVLVGDERHDLMAMTADGDDLLVSGHPDLQRDEYRVDGHPPFLGLTRSLDEGLSWVPEALLGQADFHALLIAPDGLYALEQSGSLWHRTNEGVWSQLGSVEGRDLALDPADSSQMVVPDYDGAVWLSDDGGRSWATRQGAPALIEVEWVRDELLGVTADGDVWRRAASGEWTRIADAPAGDVDTFHIDSDGMWWLATAGGVLHSSSNGGGAWREVYRPPTTS